MKQRLVGAAVLVSLVVIFVPIILSGPVDTGSVDLPMTIPPPPFSDSPKPDTRLLEEKVNQLRPVQTPRPVVSDQPDTGSVTQNEQKESVLEKAAVELKAPTDKDLAAWDVQVGSFGQSQNAIRLRDQLRSKGYKAFVESTKVNGKTTWRVRVGPEIERETAEKLANKLKSEEKLPARVYSHE